MLVNMLISSPEDFRLSVVMFASAAVIGEQDVNEEDMPLIQNKLHCLLSWMPTKKKYICESNIDQWKVMHPEAKHESCIYRMQDLL